MEMLSGESLGALITRKKRLEPNIAVQILLPVASALSAAHAKGIVHRDLKPDNIMLATEEQSRKLVPKVLDFGIARVLRDDIERHQTMAGEVLGSPDYMSPEQARGQLDIDHRTDIWTFSVLLYESITGKRPFDGHNYNALIASIVSNPPMPVHAYGVTDTELSGIIDRGLSKSTTARWQSMRDLGTALAHWAVDHGIHQDITGMSIHSEWLASAPARLMTLQPAQMPRLPVPGAEPHAANSTAPVVAKDGAEWQGLRGDGRKKWFVGASIVVTLLVILLVGTNMRSLFSEPASPGTDVDAGPSAQPSSSTAPTPPAPNPPPTASEVPTSQPSAKASPSASATTKAKAPVTQPRKKAPPVPTNIKF
jgi:serine/threonine-protein kinase